MTINEKMKAIRLENKLTQVKMSRIIGCNDRNYYCIERGVVKIKTSELINFCKYFNISADYLLDLDVEARINYRAKKIVSEIFMMINENTKHL